MFYVLEFEVNYCWDVKDVNYEYCRCPEEETFACGRKDGITMVVTRAKGIVPIIHTLWRLGCTEYALSAFRKAGVTGGKLRPGVVKVVRRGVRRKVPTYYEIEIVGKGGSLLHSEGVRLLEQCPYCGTKRYTSTTNGINVDLSEWDGSDIFQMDEGSPFLVSEKFAEMVRRKRFRGITLVPAKEWRDPFAYMDPPPPAPPEDLGPVIKMLRERERQKREQGNR